MEVVPLQGDGSQVLEQRYGHLMERSVVWASARELLAPTERDAWRQWFEQVGPDRAWQTLRDEVQERQLEGVFKPRRSLATVSAWADRERGGRSA